jgi:hypothetical protein
MDFGRLGLHHKVENKNTGGSVAFMMRKLRIFVEYFKTIF